MRGIWRVVIALLLVGAPALWLPTFAVDAAGNAPSSGTTAQINNDDPEELCTSGNPRKQKKCRYNGWDNGNWPDDNENGNDNDDGVVLTTNTVATTPSGLTVELWRSSETPDPNAPLVLVVHGDGASIARVSWWSTGPTADNPTGDDMAHFGEQGYDCGGVQPCEATWTVTPRHNGYYSVYARVRDVTGQEVEAVWRFTAGEPPQ
jgi:hypothetical protein